MHIYGGDSTTIGKEISKESRRAVYIFLVALGIILVISVCSMFGVNLLPSFDTVQAVSGGPDHVTMADGTVESAKQLVKAGVAIGGAVWQNGMVAVVAIYGIAWMANTYFDNYKTEMQDMLTSLVTAYPWTIAIAFFTVSVLINSQGAVVVSMLPLAYSLGIPGWVLLGVMPSVYGYFFIPNYPSDIATVNFDRTGTTVIGKYLFNHSSMIPGLIHVVTATIVGYFISFLFHSLGLY